MQIRVTEVNPVSIESGIFSYSRLLSMLGISSLKFDHRNSTFQITNRALEHPDDVRAGWQLDMSNNNISIGRYYYYSTEQGWGPYSCDSLHKVGLLQNGALYTADIYGATYS